VPLHEAIETVIETSKITASRIFVLIIIDLLLTPLLHRLTKTWQSGQYLGCSPATVCFSFHEFSQRSSQVRPSVRRDG
jgi:hypothetical protein